MFPAASGNMFMFAPLAASGKLFALICYVLHSTSCIRKDVHHECKCWVTTVQNIKLREPKRKQQNNSILVDGISDSIKRLKPSN